jgi:hypothetical protein
MATMPNSVTNTPGEEKDCKAGGQEGAAWAGGRVQARSWLTPRDAAATQSAPLGLAPPPLASPGQLQAQAAVAEWLRAAEGPTPANRWTGAAQGVVKLTPIGTMSTCSHAFSAAPSMIPATMLPKVRPAARPGGGGFMGG